MPISDEQFERLLGEVTKIGKKIDALTKATTAMADAIVMQIKSDVDVKKKMEKFFAEELRLLKISGEDKKSDETEHDKRF
jgi:hypothetical protein